MEDNWSFSRGGKGYSRGRGRPHFRGRGQGHGHYPRRAAAEHGRGQRSDAVQLEVEELFQKSFTFRKTKTDEPLNPDEWSLVAVAAKHPPSSEDQADSEMSRVTRQNFSLHSPLHIYPILNTA